MQSGKGEDKIYFVTCGEYLKIGVAQNTRKRLAGLQTGCPLQLKLEAEWHVGHLVAYCIEEDMHDLLKPFSVGGEWFRIGLEEAIRLAQKEMPDFATLFYRTDVEAPRPHPSNRKRGPNKGQKPLLRFDYLAEVDTTYARKVEREATAREVEKLAKTAQSLRSYADKFRKLGIVKDGQ